jgi:tyrosyl-tRNA synthetase
VPSLAADLEFRGLIHQVTDEALRARLDDGGLTVYTGFDPTATSLHVGSLLQLCMLRRLQLGGHRPISLAGGGTGLIGDPGGKAGERVLLSEDELAANLEGIAGQLGQFLDLSEGAGANRALLLDNSAWLKELPVVAFLRDVGKHFTVNQMVAKESVKTRFERPDQGISYTEFSYMLLQAYDFLRLHLDFGCELQMGGSDQWGNITLGVELIHKVTGGQAYGLTTPLVVKADGTKFGKSESGTVWLDAQRTSPYLLYQFFFQTEDAVVGQYLRYFTFLSHDEITALDAAVSCEPQRREAQRSLAAEVCRLVHGAEATGRAERASQALFSEEIAELDEATLLEVVRDAPSSDRARGDLGSLTLVDALVESGLVSSKGEARRFIDQGGVYVNNLRQRDVDAVVSKDQLLVDRYVLLRRGRRQYHVVRFE